MSSKFSRHDQLPNNRGPSPKIHSAKTIPDTNYAPWRDQILQHLEDTGVGF
jgi:hypothetical protein